MTWEAEVHTPTPRPAIIYNKANHDSRASKKQKREIAHVPATTIDNRPLTNDPLCIKLHNLHNAPPLMHNHKSFCLNNLRTDALPENNPCPACINACPPPHQPLK